MTKFYCSVSFARQYTYLGCPVIIFKKYCILLSEDLFTFTNSVDPDVLKSTHLGVSGIQRVNISHLFLFQLTVKNSSKYSFTVIDSYK